MLQFLLWTVLLHVLGGETAKMVPLLLSAAFSTLSILSSYSSSSSLSAALRCSDGVVELSDSEDLAPPLISGPPDQCICL